MTRNGLDLKQLHALTLSLINDDQSIMRALNWVDQVLPRFAEACRLSLNNAAENNAAENNAAENNAAENNGAESEIETWLTWLESDSAQVITEAGKGEFYHWRQTWLRLLLETTRELQRRSADRASDQNLAETLQCRYELLPACFSAPFWVDLVGYLRSASERAIDLPRLPNESKPTYRLAFPLVLSDPVIDDGSETNVILAEFILEPVSSFTSGVYLHPEQAAVRCMDESFARCFHNAAVVAQREFRGSGDSLPDVRVRIRTAKPGHEQFLQGMVLRGASGAGALAIGLYALYHRIPLFNRDLAISFALCDARGGNVDGACHAVGGGDDKVRGCTRQHVQRLLVAAEQQRDLAPYGDKLGIKVLGAVSLEEAVELAAGPRRPLPGGAPSRKIVLVYHQREPADDYLSRMLTQGLVANGHEVFSDRHLPIGIAWAKEIEQQIRLADAIVVLVSNASIASDMLAWEIQAAYETQQDGKPRLLPIRVQYEGKLPERLAYILDPVQQAFWQGLQDDDRLLLDLEHALRQPFGPHEPVEPSYSPSDLDPARDDLEPSPGPVPLQSRFYIAREADQEFLSAVRHRQGIILIKGPRQVGKSSLLARGLDAAHKKGMTTALTDFQKLNSSALQSPEAFYQALAHMLARQLKLETSLEDLWVSGRSANINFEEYMEDHVLPYTSPLVWGMDEVDRVLISAPFSSDVFGLFRSWANERQARPGSPWNGVTMIMAYATEAHLFIKDLNQSPFNIGTRFELRDFTVHEVADLNSRYGSPLQGDVEIAQFYCLVGGHPYLVRRGLYSMVQQGIDIDAFEEEAARNSGPFEDHLRRIVALVAHHEDNANGLRAILCGETCPSYEIFYRLRSAGVIVGDAPQESRPRCQLYAIYLKRHLL